MKPLILDNNISLNVRLKKLMDSTLSPICGLTQRVSFMTRNAHDAKFMTAGGELTGVHILRNQPRPNVNTYHIGGGGIFFEEPLIRTLGESIERYSQLISEVNLKGKMVFASYRQMLKKKEPILDAKKLHFYEKQQIEGTSFMPFDPEKPLNWLRTKSLIDNNLVWVPAQLLLVGYVPKFQDNEPWLLPAVTTGTAAHTDPLKAMRGAILELIQIDAVMGHWYTNAIAQRVGLDNRVRAMIRLINDHFPNKDIMPEFYWIPNKDLPGMIIACVIKGQNTTPAVAVGLGCDLSLGQALYKSLLEAVSVVQLAKITLLYQDPALKEDSTKGESGKIMDFDNNVAFYSIPGNEEIINKKFNRSKFINASDLPEDSKESCENEIQMLIAAFAETEKQLFFLNLTTNDISKLGFSTYRVWSPDTISLSLPSLPTKAQERFSDYGSVQHIHPHPYP